MGEALETAKICGGVTKAGTRCVSLVYGNNARCGNHRGGPEHDGSPPPPKVIRDRCNAFTAKGKQCNSVAAYGRLECPSHLPEKVERDNEEARQFAVHRQAELLAQAAKDEAAAAEWKRKLAENEARRVRAELEANEARTLALKQPSEVMAILEAARRLLMASEATPDNVAHATALVALGTQIRLCASWAAGQAKRAEDQDSGFEKEGKL